MSLTVSTSAIRDWHRCSRLYQHKHVDRVEPVVEAKATRFGTTVHHGLNAWFTAAWWGQKKGRLKAALAELQRERDEFEQARMRVMILGYHVMWSSVSMNVVAVEHSFEVPLFYCHYCGNRTQPEAWGRHSQLCYQCNSAECISITFRSRIDAIVEVDGLTYVVEHKTTSSDIGDGSLYWKQRRMDSQISNYALAQSKLGVDVVGTIYDVLKKPKHKPTCDETPLDFERRMMSAVISNPEAYYARRTITRLDFERAAAERDLIDSAAQIAHARRLGVFPRNPDACLDYGRTCEFFPVCAGTTTINNEAVFRQRKA